MLTAHRRPIETLENRAKAAGFHETAYGKKSTPINIEETLAMVNSPLYKGGTYAAECSSINPLGLCLGLARAVEENGGTVAEMSHVTRVSERGGTAEYPWMVHTKAYNFDGQVRARHVVCCTNAVPWWFSGYYSLLNMSFYSSILVTKPFPTGKLDEAVATRANVCDDRFALAYYRRLDGDRLMWGGRLPFAFPVPYGYVEKSLTKDLEASFPQLKGLVRTEAVWQGRMVTGYPWMPIVRQTNPKGLWINAGHFAHGVVPTAAAGVAVADAIIGEREKLSHWEAVNAPWFTLWAPLKQLGAQIGSSGSIVKDWWEGCC